MADDINLHLAYKYVKQKLECTSVKLLRLKKLKYF